MNHLTPEERAEFIMGEPAHERRRAMQDHLKQCADCAAAVESWRQTRGRLDAWRVPRGRGRARLPELWRWAAAVAALVAVGFIVGRSSTPRVNIEALRADLERSLVPAVVAEVRSDLQRAFEEQAMANVERASAQVPLQLQQQIERELAQWSARDVRRSQEIARLREELFRVIQEAREADRRATVALVEQVRRQHAADYVALRRDLETVASVTEDEIKRARLDWLQVVASTSAVRENNQP